MGVCGVCGGLWVLLTTLVVSKFVKLRFCEKDTKNLGNHYLRFYVVTVKFTVEISQNFVVFSKYMNFSTLVYQNPFQS